MGNMCVSVLYIEYYPIRWPPNTVQYSVPSIISCVVCPTYRQVA